MMNTSQSLARIGAVAAVAGAGLLLVATLLHPLGSDPNDPTAAFAEYAEDPLWVWSHLGQFFGITLLSVALVAFAATLGSGPAAAWGRVGHVGAAAIVAVAAALLAVDGVALKVMVNRWASATGDTKALVFEAAFAVRQIEIGLASLLSLVSGLTLLAFGLAIVLSIRYPKWLGGIALLGGLGLVLAGAAQATTGFSGTAMTLSMLASAALLVWGILTGILMWRVTAKVTGKNEREFDAPGVFR